MPFSDTVLVKDSKGKNEMTVEERNAFVTEYMTKLFYYCLKKTGDTYEAEELAADISLCVLVELERGTLVTDPDAWVWGIAHNRYVRWVKSRCSHRENISSAEITEYDISDSSSVEDNIIHAEEMALLKRELAFISSEYRDIVLAYYIEDRSVSDIARSLGIPDGTVMTRLFRARKILKEGMNMAREFGKLSYNPENLYFTMNGTSGSDGAPWCYLERLLEKNIMLAAYRTPSTAEELAIEVGVALPYIEEELEILTNATLMKKNGKKYETSFFIIGREAQERAEEHLKTIAEPLTDAVCHMVELELETQQSSFEKYQPISDVKWYYIMEKVDICERGVYTKDELDSVDHSKIGEWGHTIRPNGGEWDIIGREIVFKDEARIGLCGCVTTPYERGLPYIDWRKYEFFGMQNILRLNYNEAAVLKEFVLGNGIDENTAEKMCEKGLLRKTADGYEPTFLVVHQDRVVDLSNEKREKYERYEKTAREYAKKHYRYCLELIKNETPKSLKNDIYQINQAAGEIFHLRECVIKEALRTSRITIPDDRARVDMLGACLRI